MLNDIKTILHVAKTFGVFPFKIINNGHSVVIKKCQLVYSIFIFTIGIMTRGYQLYKYTKNLEDFKLIEIVTITIFLLELILVACDGAITVLKKNQLVEAISALRVYDVSSSYCHRKNKQLSVVNGIRCFVIVVILVQSVQAYLYINKRGEFAFKIIYRISVTIFSASISVQIYKFCSIMWLLYTRLDHLLQATILCEGENKTYHSN